jgi:hypothetical protein
MTIERDQHRRRSSLPRGPAAERIPGVTPRLGRGIGIIVLVLLLAMVGVVHEAVDRSPPTLSVTPSSATAGELVQISGMGFRPRTSLQLWWDGSMADMPEVTADDTGSFTVAVTVPPSSSPGAHRLTAAIKSHGISDDGGSVSQSGVLSVAHDQPIPGEVASTTVEVTAPPLALAPPLREPEAEPDHQAQEPSATPEMTHHRSSPAPAASPDPSHDHATSPPAATPDPSHDHTPAPTQPPTGHGGHGDPITCAGYAEPRLFLETQDWWVATPGQGGDDFGHVHVGTCFPFAQTIAGVVQFDMRVMMHNNPGTLARVDVAIHTASGEGVIVPVSFNKTCSGTCTYWAKVAVDTRGSPDGWQEFRFKARVDEPDGNRMVTSSGWPAYVNNGSPRHDVTSAGGIVARGWYEGVGYQNAWMSTPPMAPVSGSWTFDVKLQPGAGGTPTTSHLVAVDPNFHAGNPGITIKEGKGECRCSITIDTTRLSNGVHRLFLRADSALPQGTTHSGVLTIQFVVQN